MAARSKEVRVVTAADLNVDCGQRAETVEGIADAESRASGEIVEDDGTIGVEKIMTVLQAAKVI
jgi:electron transfer flavoprotein alpha/beta subunit